MESIVGLGYFHSCLVLAITCVIMEEEVKLGYLFLLVAELIEPVFNFFRPFRNGWNHKFQSRQAVEAWRLEQIVAAHGGERSSGGRGSRHSAGEGRRSGAAVCGGEEGSDEERELGSL